jgi:hypothetical protein
MDIAEAGEASSTAGAMSGKTTRVAFMAASVQCERSNNGKRLRSSVSNGSGFGPEKRFGSVPDPSINPTRSVLAELLPGPDIEPWVFSRVGTGPRFHFTVPSTLPRLWLHLSI